MQLAVFGLSAGGEGHERGRLSPRPWYPRGTVCNAPPVQCRKHHQMPSQFAVGARAGAAPAPAHRRGRSRADSRDNWCAPAAPHFAPETGAGSLRARVRCAPGARVAGRGIDESPGAPAQQLVAAACASAAQLSAETRKNSGLGMEAMSLGTSTPRLAAPWPPPWARLSMPAGAAIEQVQPAAQVEFVAARRPPKSSWLSRIRMRASGFCVR